MEKIRFKCLLGAAHKPTIFWEILAMSRLRNYYRQFKYSDVERQSLYLFAAANFIFLLLYQREVDLSSQSTAKSVLTFALLLPSIIAAFLTRHHPKVVLAIFSGSYLAIMPLVIYELPSPVTGALVMALMYVVYAEVLIIRTKPIIFIPIILVCVLFFVFDYEFDRSTDNTILLDKETGFSYMILYSGTTFIIFTFSALFLTNIKAVLKRYVKLNNKSRELNRDLIGINVKLTKQNEAFITISDFNSHELRKEVANLQGLLDLATTKEVDSDWDDHKNIQMMTTTTLKLDVILKKNEQLLAENTY